MTSFSINASSVALASAIPRAQPITREKPIGEALDRVPESPPTPNTAQQEDILLGVTLPRPVTPPTVMPPPKGTPLSLHRLPIRTPDRPRPRRDPSPEDSPLATELPASTAPAGLGREGGEGGGRPKRRRNHTARYREGQEQGFIHESQERQRAK